MSRIITRGEWGAASPKNSMVVARYPMSKLWFHHSVTGATGDSHANARQIQQIAFGRGYSDTSYTFLLHPNGDILEGRNLRYVGAHTLNHNSSSLAFSFIGNYENDQPTPAQFVSATWLRQELIRTGFLTLGTYPTGGHRDTGFSTACPGRNIYRQLEEFRRYSGSVTPDPILPKDVKAMRMVYDHNGAYFVDGASGVYLALTHPDQIDALVKAGVPHVGGVSSHVHNFVRSVAGNHGWGG